MAHNVQVVLFVLFCTSLPHAGNLGHLTQVRHDGCKSSATHSYIYIYTMTSVYLCAQTVVWLPMFGFFNVRTDVNAWDCTWIAHGGCMDTVTNGRVNSVSNCSKKPGTILMWV